ncbi:MAG: BREX-1 system phosphatase PglZ type A [Clostridia bacterium]|nr:BREX-1 system phosphatase PglZ type A [Clostridia bacterium]
MQATLSARFARPLGPYEKRRIIVWRDEEREFESGVQELEIPGVRVLTMREGHLFELRRQIEVDYAQENILLYCPLTFKRPEDNGLLDVFLYGETFRADYWSQLFDRLGAENTRAMREYARSVAAFFRSRERCARLRALGGELRTPEQLRDGIFAVLCGLKAGGLERAVRAVLADESGAALAAIGKICGEDAFWQAVRSAYGYEGAHEPLRFGAHMLASASAAGGAAPEGLPVSEAHATQTYGFFVAWLHDDREGLLRLCRAVQESEGVEARLSRMSPAQLAAHAVFPCADVLLLAAPLRAFAQGRFNVDDAQALIAARRDQPWYDETAAYYELLGGLAELTLLGRACAGGFHYASAQELWDAYAQKLYAVDACYRHVCQSGERALRSGVIALEDELAAAREAAENLYKNALLGGLGDAWSQQLARLGGRLTFGGKRQECFYAEHVARAESRVFVIISDALRYEVGVELAARLCGRLPGNAECAPMQAVYPTNTAEGMAALLPHGALSLDARLEPCCDGMKTHSANRESVLRAACAQSAAVDYPAFRQMNRAQRAELVRGMKVVYIYHNRIDRAGESGSDVFAACGEAMDELTQLVRILAQELSAATVYITADHGFVYTRAPLEEYDKAETALLPGEVLALGRRHAIVRGGGQAEAVLTMTMEPWQRPELTAAFPRGSLRFRMQGGSGTFMHGGLSLQELMVPLIIYRNKKAGQKGYQAIDKVGLALISQTRRISNNIFTLQFYQTEPCTEKMRQRKVCLHFEDAAGARISDAHTILADRSTPDNSRRSFHVTFRLTQSGFDRDADYMLLALDAEDGQTLIREAFKINIAFAQEFDF